MKDAFTLKMSEKPTLESTLLGALPIYSLIQDLVTIRPDAGFRDRRDHIIAVCKTHFGDDVQYLPDGEVRTYFASQGTDSSFYGHLRSVNVLPDPKDSSILYVIFRSNGDKNLGMVKLPTDGMKLLPPDFICDFVLDNLSSVGGMLLAHGVYQDHLFAKSEYDGLTGLLRKEAVEGLLSTLIPQASEERKLAAFMMDLDNFRNYNTRHGHPQADELLKAVGRVVRSSLRATDYGVRYGGEEIVGLLPDTNQKGALIVAERICNAVRSLDLVKLKLPAGITCSLGVAILPDQASSGRELLEKADYALYRAKNTGKDQVVLYSP